ncbi:hypothetical protein ACUXIK_001702 [Staphylococcus hominis]
MVLNKNGKQSQKEAQKRLNERIEEKQNNKTPTTLKTLTFHAACDEWFEHYKLISGSKQSTITTKSYKVAHINKQKHTNSYTKYRDRKTCNKPHYASQSHIIIIAIRCVS